MRTLYQSLLDYDMALLKAIAECRSASLTTPSRLEAVKRLAEALLSPADTAIALAHLSAEEQEALQMLLDAGGQVEGPRFSRHYGPIRPMGAARLEREKPWRSPANPAEGLWYKGFIFKGFRLAEQGNLEMVYIPTDLQALLQLSRPETQEVPPIQEASTLADNGENFQVAETPPPALLRSGEGRLRENFFSLLVHLQTEPVRLQQNQLTSKDKDALVGCLLPSGEPGLPVEAEIEFLLHLGQRAGLLIARHGRLRPDRDPARSWLQAQAGQQNRQLQTTWQADPTWNDLWHVPGLTPQPTGWENSPLLARSKILGYLARLATGPDTWFSLDSLIMAIKQTEPDFQRPDGNYDNWYIKDEQGQFLMGFDSWDQVEGRLIRYLVGSVLFWLGVVDLGFPLSPRPGALDGPTSFRLTPAGIAFLQAQPEPDAAGRVPLLRVDGNFCATVPAQASLYDRFQLARFATLETRQPDRVIYRISRASVNRALRNGVQADQIIAFLARATNSQTPLKVVETVRTWGTRRGVVQLEPVTLLRLNDESLLAELRQHPGLYPLLGEVLNPNVLLIPADKVAEVRRLLVELGYLES